MMIQTLPKSMAATTSNQTNHSATSNKTSETLASQGINHTNQYNRTYTHAHANNFCFLPSLVFFNFSHVYDMVILVGVVDAASAVVYSVFQNGYSLVTLVGRASSAIFFRFRHLPGIDSPLLFNRIVANKCRITAQIMTKGGGL